MAKIKIVGVIKAVCDRVLGIGRRIGARRFLFVWSAVSFGIALYAGLGDTIRLYSTNVILEPDMFVLTRTLDVVFGFLRLFVPMFILVVAAKYIFDFDGKHTGRASATFKTAVFASVAAGLAIAVFYYLDAGHIIGGNNPGRLCADGAVCRFGWDMLSLAGQAFLASALGILLTLLGLRGVYDELSFMLTKK
ncbi:MAG: hypothetical protein LBQ49_02155 [Rickettsiales bacterium]|nr:hypothetical protein [Rickettsiales bacterium]